MNNGLFHRLFVLPPWLRENATVRRVYRSALLGIGLSLAYFMLIPLVFPEHSAHFLPLLGVSSLFFAVAAVLVRLNRIKRFGIIYLLGCWVVVTAIVSRSGGTLTPFFGFYTVLVMFAVLIADWQLARIIGAITLLAGLVLAYFGTHGLIDPPVATPLSAWITQSLIMLLLILLAFLIAGNIRQTMARLQAELAERKQVEEALRESEERYRTLFETFPDVIVVQTVDGKVVHMNRAAVQQIGLTPDEMNNPNRAAFIHPDDAPMIAQAIRDLIKSDRLSTDLIENRFVDSSGRSHWYSGIISKVHWKGQLALQIVTREITAARLAEERLRESEEKFRTIFELAPYGIIIQQQGGVVTTANQAFLDVVGYTSEQVVNQNIFDFEKFRIFREPEAIEVLRQQIISGKRVLNAEVDVYDSDGRATTQLVSSQYIELSGEPHTLTIGVDITARKQAEAEIRALNAALEQKASHMALLNEVAHDMSMLSDLRLSLRNSLMKLQPIVPMDAFFVGIYEHSNDTINFLILYDDGVYYDPPIGPLPRPSSIATVIDTGKGMLLNRTPEQISQANQSKFTFGNTSRYSASMLVWPLILGGVIIGVISVHSYSMNAYNESHQELLRDVAYQIAIAVENSRLYDSLRRELAEKEKAALEIQELNAALLEKASQLATLNEIAHEVSALTDLKTTLQRVLDKLKSVVQLDVFYVVIYTPENNRVHFPIMFDDNQYWNQAPDTLNRLGLSAQVLQSGQPIFINRTDAELRALEADDVEAHARLGNRNRVSASMIIVPVLLGSRVIGLLSIQSYTLNAYAQKHVDLLVGVAYQVGVAIDNANLYDSLWKELSTRKQAEQRLSQLNSELQERAAQLATINEIAYEIAALTDLRSALQRTLDKLKSSVQLDAFYVALYDSESELVTFPIMYDVDQFWDEPPNQLTRPGITAQVLDTGQPLLLNRTSEQIRELEAAASHQAVMLGNKNQVSASIVVVPLILGRRAIGFISMQSYSLNAYTPRHVELLMGVAYQVAVAVDNATLYDSLQNELTTRRLAEQQLAQLNTELEQRVIQRTAQLEATNRELEAFAYSVSHDLRAPLRSIDGFSQALLEDYNAVLDPVGQGYLTRIRSAAQRMGNMIDSMLTLSRITRAQLNLQSVNLSSVVAEIIVTLKEEQPDRAVNIHIAPEVYGKCDARLMQIALRNLLENAWKYSSKEAVAEISFGYRQMGGETVFFISDNGVGFDMSQSGKLFTAFQRLHTDQEFQGNGIGLATVQRVINRHGGKIWSESRTGEGATFYFTLMSGAAEP